MTTGILTAPAAPPTASRDTGIAGPSASGWMILDVTLAIGAVGATLVIANLGHMPAGWAAFLALRVSVKNLLIIVGFAALWPLVLRSAGLYEPGRLRTGRGEAVRLLGACAIGTLLALVFPATSRSGAIRPDDMGLFFGASLIMTLAARKGTRRLRRAVRGEPVRRVVVVGSGPLALRICRGLQAGDAQGDLSTILGFVDTAPQPHLVEAGLRHLGGVAGLERLLMTEVVDEVYLALPFKSGYAEIQTAIHACERVGVRACYPTDIFQVSLARARGLLPAARPVMTMEVAPDDARLVVKRVLDVAGALVALMLFLPVMFAVALLVKLTSPGPVFFAQERYGFMKRRFRMYKFRTMVVDAERLQAVLEDRNEATGPAFKIRDDPRLTRAGSFLRRTSLDELPQLWNVLVGEMSLVGPRPMAVRDVGRFDEPWLMRRFSVQPGLTCLWQISGRSSLGFDQWIALDLEYIDNWSLTQDFVILMKTIPAVVLGVGAS